MKKVLSILILSLVFFSNVNADERGGKLDKLFSQLKDTKDLPTAQVIEKEIWDIWSIHPTDDRRGFRLTELLIQGTRLMNMRELNKAHEVFTKIIAVENDWAEAWNKRATVLYLMKQYESSLADIKITLVLEPRHFGALSGQARIFIKLQEYEKAISSLQTALNFYPLFKSGELISEIEKLIKEKSV